MKRDRRSGVGTGRSGLVAVVAAVAALPSDCGGLKEIM